MPALSVIIPTLNEASELPETIKRARAIPEVREIIVVDAGSTDDTRAIAREHNCIVIESEPNRGKQLRLGAHRASGDVILFLHADTWLPENAAVGGEGFAEFEFLHERDSRHAAAILEHTAFHKNGLVAKEAVGKRPQQPTA